MTLIPIQAVVHEKHSKDMNDATLLLIGKTEEGFLCVVEVKNKR